MRNITNTPTKLDGTARYAPESIAYGAGGAFGDGGDGGAGEDAVSDANTTLEMGTNTTLEMGVRSCVNTY